MMKLLMRMMKKGWDWIGRWIPWMVRHWVFGWDVKMVEVFGQGVGTTGVGPGVGRGVGTGVGSGVGAFVVASVGAFIGALRLWVHSWVHRW